MPSWNPIPTDGGVLDKLFHQTSLTVKIFGVPPNGYTLTLIGLLIIFVIALTANAITERLTSKKVGGLLSATIVTILGSFLASAYLRLPGDFEIESVRIIAALLGAVIIAVFYTLMRNAGKK